MVIPKAICCLPLVRCLRRPRHIECNSRQEEVTRWIIVATELVTCAALVGPFDLSHTSWMSLDRTLHRLNRVCEVSTAVEHNQRELRVPPHRVFKQLLVHFPLKVSWPFPHQTFSNEHV